jgi:hypothetical protein
MNRIIGYGCARHSSVLDGLSDFSQSIIAFAKGEHKCRCFKLGLYGSQ